jgi:glucuronoarabinoxylan endo-1,4-beta-xylanase
MHTKALAGVLLGLVACVWNAPAVTVTIDHQVSYQTILGFGGTGINGSVADLVDDMGLSVHRSVIEPEGGAFPAFSVLAQLRQRGVQTFIAVPWSPPAYMKSNNSTINGGTLLSQYYTAFANHLGKYITDFRRDVGIDLYALSPQNEPRFPEPYNSCVYTKETYRDMLRVVGQTLRAGNIHTPIFAAEDMLTAFTVEPMIQYSCIDTSTRRYIGAVSVHGYSDGVNPIPTSDAALAWGGPRGLAAFGAAQGLPVWQTEMSGFHDSWYGGTTSGWQSGTKPGAWSLAQAIYTALKYGKVELFCYWVLSSYNSWDEGYSLIWNGNKTREYYVMKQFARYVRPGAVQMEVSSDDDYVHVLAYRHPADQTLTVVILNTSTTTKSIALNGSNVPSQLRGYRSTPSDNCVDIGMVNKGSISLGSESILTLVASGYSPPAVMVRPTVLGATRTSRGMNAVARTLMLLDGRLVSPERSQRPPAPSACVSGPSDRGGRPLVILGY